jgi:hypothetical protein
MAGEQQSWINASIGEDDESDDMDMDAIWTKKKARGWLVTLVLPRFFRRCGSKGLRIRRPAFGFQERVRFVG